MTHAPGRRVDKNLVARLDPGPVDERFPGRQGHQRKRRRLGHGQGARFVRSQVRIDRHVLRQRTAVRADPSGACIDLVPRLKI